MAEMWLIICGIISIAVVIVTIAYVTLFYKNFTQFKRLVSKLQIFTIGVFVALWIIWIPLYYIGYDFKDVNEGFRPFLYSLFTTLRAFVFEFDYDMLMETLSKQGYAVRLGYSLYGFILSVVAPLLTMGNVLSLFGHVKDEIRYLITWRKKIYIFSDLNRQALCLAESIKKNEENVCVVFANVSFDDDLNEDIEDAREMKAICLKEDVQHIDILSKKKDVEIFLISPDESQNVDDAVNITQMLNAVEEKNRKYNVKLFVFNNQPSATYILDSLKYDNLIRKKPEEKKEEDNTEEKKKKKVSYKDYKSRLDENSFLFKIRRIDMAQKLAWSTVPKMKLFDLMHKKGKEPLSVLIVGMGNYGMEFFKTLIWYCQYEGYELQLNIIDKMDVTSRINYLCPELLSTNRVKREGEAYYDIEVIPDIDVETAEFQNLLFYDGEDKRKKELSKRLQDTDVAIVVLGDDEKNIEFSVHLRRLFDRVYYKKNPGVDKATIKARADIENENENIAIYSMVYDKDKSKLLSGDFLISEKNTPYHIRFIGQMQDQYFYDNIYNVKDEEAAFKQHISWIETMKITNRYYVNDEVGKAELLGYATKNIDEQTEIYEKFEYFRLSSMCREIYERGLRDSAFQKERHCGETKEEKAKRKDALLPQNIEIANINRKLREEDEKLEKKLEAEGRIDEFTESPKLEFLPDYCTCARCDLRRKNEHRRWNAYMRTEGFVGSNGYVDANGIENRKIRDDRARIHNCICDWAELPTYEKEKDDYEENDNV